MSNPHEGLIRNFQRDRLRLVAYIRSLVGDPDLAEDIFQETAVVVLKKTESFDPNRDVGAWCRGIARNLILRQRERSRRLVPFTDERMEQLVDTAFEENRGREFLESRLARLRSCLKQLPARGREVLELRYVSSLTLKELASRMKQTDGAVQVKLSRLRQVLADCITRRTTGEEELPS